MPDWLDVKSIDILDWNKDNLRNQVSVRTTANI